MQRIIPVPAAVGLIWINATAAAPGSLKAWTAVVRQPELDLVVTRGPDDNRSYTDLHVAIRDAFDAMRRQLEAYRALLRGDVKTH